MARCLTCLIAVVGSLYACQLPGHSGAIAAPQKSPKPNYRQKMKEMIDGSEWCKFDIHPDVFIVKTKKLEKPLKMLVEDEKSDFRNIERYGGGIYIPHDTVLTFLSKEGRRWARSAFG